MTKKTGRSKVGTEEDRNRVYGEIAEAAARGEPATRICKRYGISRSMASRIIRKSKAKKAA